MFTNLNDKRNGEVRRGLKGCEVTGDPGWVTFPGGILPLHILVPGAEPGGCGGEGRLYQQARLQTRSAAAAARRGIQHMSLTWEARIL